MMLLKGVIPIPPARKMCFLLLFLWRVKSPIGPLAFIDSPIFISSKVFLKPDSGLIFVVIIRFSSVGDEEMVKALVGPLLSGYLSLGNVR